MPNFFKYFKTYIVDYIIVLSIELYIIFIAIRSQPFLPEFDPFDPKINHDFNPNDTVSDLNCLALATITPLTVVSLRYIYEYLKKNKNTGSLVGLVKSAFKLENLHKLHITVLGLFYSITITGLIVCILKNWIGRPRPDFIGRCKPSYSSINLPGSGSSSSAGSANPIGKLLYDITICTGDYETILEGLRSHPSGHSAVSFSGLNYLTVWLISQIHYFPSLSSSSAQTVNNNNVGAPLISTSEDSKIETIRSKQIWKFLLLLVPNFIALWVAITRIQDSRHHPTDIIGGSIIGLSVSSVVHWKFFKNGKAIYLKEVGEGLPLPLYND